MTENSYLFDFYIITENDDFGETAHGPYTRFEAESRLQVDEKIITREQLSALRRQDPTIIKSEDTTISSSHNHNKMLREIKNWGVILLVIGVIQIFTSGASINTWGLLLISVGLSSFYFRSPAMFVIYGSTLSWAAISNALSGSGSWMTFSLLQAFFAFQTFRQFFQFRTMFSPVQKTENDFNQNEQLDPDKAAKIFPWASLTLGILSFLGFSTLFLGIIVFIAITGNDLYPTLLDILEGIVIDFAVLGLATGLASLLVRYKYKLASIIGLITGALVLLIEVILAVI